MALQRKAARVEFDQPVNGRKPEPAPPRTRGKEGFEDPFHEFGVGTFEDVFLFFRFFVLACFCT